MGSKIGKEIKIGGFLIVVFLLFVLGLNFLKGNSMFSKDIEFHTFYDNVQGLQVSADVQINGVSIGKVKEIELQDDKTIKVVFNITKGVRLPNSSVAKLTSNDLLTGSKIISIEFEEDNGTSAEPGFMVGVESEGILDDLSNSVSPLVATVQSTLASLDTVLNSVNDLINENTINHVNQSFAHLENTMAELQQFSVVLNEQSQNLSNSMTHIESVTGNLADNNSSIATTLQNLEGFSNQLTETDLKKTLNPLESASVELDGLMQKVNSNQGTLGKLIHDDEVYNNLNGALHSIEGMIQEIKSKPGKYLNISVFPAKQR